jgi:hypothetical protein
VGWFASVGDDVEVCEEDADLNGVVLYENPSEGDESGSRRSWTIFARCTLGRVRDAVMHQLVETANTRAR